MTEQERENFEAQGYHVLRNALTSDEIALLKQACREMLQTPISHPYAHFLLPAPIHNPPPDNPRGVWAGFNLQLFHDLFWDLAYHPKIAMAVDACIGPDINLYETASIHKIPGFPGTFRDWHQDSEYSDPQSNDRSVTVILYLDSMNGETGATWVVPGSHKQGKIPHVEPAESVTSKAREVENKTQYHPKGISFDFAAGDALIFLTRLVHRSGANNSTESKWSLAYNYCRKDTLDTERMNTYVGGYLPITRNGEIYRVGERFTK
jgi:ectoine hydroxylase-related dioxygenase (phytanoyl-CoA dioxygenase family)